MELATITPCTTSLCDFALDVVSGLSKEGQKELSSKYLYDDVGSALFDVICLLSEYGLSRAGHRTMQRHAEDVIDQLNGPVAVAELGSGSGQKTRWLLEALSRRQPVNYYPIDISRGALRCCQQELGHIKNVNLVGLEYSYLDGLEEVVKRRIENERLLVLFLGSTIGNFARREQDDFLRSVRSILSKGDTLLLATDLEKPLHVLQLAYDDPAGVTAAFNKNLLARLNRELDADFDLSRFEHEVRYDQQEKRIEMHLRSTCNQCINIGKAGFQFTMQKGETIWTESSHKFDHNEVIEMGQRSGFSCVKQWFDQEWSFAQHLFWAT